MSKSIFKSLAKNSVIISAGTLFSRIFGFLRDILIARFFGTSFLIETFLVAFRLPNIFRSLLGEEAVDSVVVPVLSEYREEKKLREVGGHLFISSLAVLFFITILGIVFSKFIVMIVAPGFLKEAEKFRLTVRCTQIVFSYLIFIGLSANLAGVLYIKNKFFIPSFSPLILNLVLILGVLFSTNLSFNPVYTLGIFVIIAGVLQFLANFSSARPYLVIELSLKKSFLDEGIIKMVRLSIPRLWAVAVYHLNIFVDTILGSFSSIVGKGAIAAIYYSNRLIQLPLAIFGLGISRAAIPRLSSLNIEENYEAFRQAFSFSLKHLSFFIIPSSLFLMGLSRPIIEAVYRRGLFSEYSVRITSSALFFYSLGIFFWGVNRLLRSVFYALQDTLTPTKTATLSLFVNVGLSLLLMRPLKVGGLALASSIASGVNFLLLLKAFQRKIGHLDNSLVEEIVKIWVSALIAMVILKLAWMNMDMNLYLKLGLVLGLGVLSYLFFSLSFKIEIARDILKWIFLRR